MVLLVSTPSILSALDAVPADQRKALDLPDSDSVPPAGPISHDQLIQLARYFRDTASSSSTSTTATTTTSSENEPHPPEYTLNTLLRGTKVYVPPPPPKPEPSPEYLALKARLLAAAEEDAYNRLMAPTAHSPPSTSQGHLQSQNPFSSSTPILSSLHDNPNGTSSAAEPSSEEDPLTPSLVLNIFLSVLITGFSVYWALTSFPTPEVLLDSVFRAVWRGGVRNSSAGGKGRGGTSEAVRVLVSLGVALGVGAAEVAIYAIYLRKMGDARRKERKLGERKVVVSREVVGGGGGGSEQVEKKGDEERDEIWGRGVNGGLRRRVRERWEEKEKEKEGIAEE